MSVTLSNKANHFKGAHSVLKKQDPDFRTYWEKKQACESGGRT